LKGKSNHGKLCNSSLKNQFKTKSLPQARVSVTQHSTIDSLLMVKVERRNLLFNRAMHLKIKVKVEFKIESDRKMIKIKVFVCFSVFWWIC
jgi:hypothetical protein